MSTDFTEHEAGTGSQPDDRTGYPTHHVLGVITTRERATGAIRALTAGGFLDSEIHVVSGSDEAEAMHARTGRTGLADLAIRVAQKLGVADDEMEVKARYEQSLRDGHFLLLVSAPTDARKDRAAEILRQHGAHSINYMGRFTREELSPPDAPRA
jgi:hypothetical protein